MKKREILTISLLVIFILLMCFAGCKTKDENNDATIEIQSSTNYTVQFDCMGGTEILSQKIIANSTVNKPTDPTREGYRFLGWYSDKFRTQVYDFSKPVTSDITLYARWQKDVVTISFETNGGEEMDPIVLRRQDMMIFPNLPIKIGYTFEAWCFDKELTHTFNFSYVPDDDVTLYVKWSKNKDGIYSVNLKGYAGEGTIVTHYNNKDGLYLPDDWEQEGYDFIGWYDNPNYTGEKYIEIKPNTNRDLVFYAKWRISKCRVHLINERQEVETKVLSQGQELTLEALPDRLGYNFDGWAYYPQGDCPRVEKVVVENQKEINLYARWAPKECTLNFYYDVNQEPYVLTNYYNECVVIPNVADDNYQLLGWYNNKDFTGVRYSSSVCIDALEMNFYAKWGPKRFDIKLELYGGVLENSKNREILQHEYGVELQLPTNVIKAGSKFVGWGMNENGEIKKITSIPAKLTGPQTVYALYEPLTYNITYDTCGGVFESPKQESKYLHGTNVYLPICSKEGYSFLGWSEVKDSKENIVNYVNSQDYGDKHYYAVYEIKAYTILIHISENLIKFQLVNYNEKIDIETPKYQGYIFDGWYSDKELTIPYKLDQNMGANNIDVYCKWVAEEFNLKFDLGEGSSDTIQNKKVKCGEKIEDPGAPKAPYLKHFIGWFTTSVPTDNDVIYQFGVMPNHDLTLYARYSEVLVKQKTYQITYYDGEEVMQLEPKTYKGQAGTYLPIPQKEGYKFKGWCLTNQLDGEPIFEITVSNNKNQVLYAKWEPIQTIVRYILSDVDYYIAYHTYGEEMPLDMTLTKDGYELEGWYSNPDLTGEPITKVQADCLNYLTVYAKWKVANYTISFDLNGGEGTLNPLTYTYGQGALLPKDLTKKGYVFAYWEDKATNSKIETISTNDFGNKELVARWSELYYEVYLVGNNGHGSLARPYYYGEEAQLPTNWTRTGYSFAGWYYDPELLDGPYLRIPKEEIGDVTFFAAWTPIQYSVSLVGQGSGTNVDSYYYGSVTYLPDDWEKDGYVFDGWYTNQGCDLRYKIELIDASMYGNKVFYSRWIPNKYTITYRTNLGSPIEKQIVECGAKIEAPTNPRRANKVFAGWFEDKELTKPYTFDVMPNKDVTLYAKWDDGAYLTYELGDNKTLVIKCEPFQSIGLMADIEKQEFNNPMFEFKGWYFDKKGHYPCPTLLTMDQHYTVYAKWQPKSFLGYLEEFNPALTENKYVIDVEDDEKLLAVIDYVLFNYIDHDVGIRFVDKAGKPINISQDASYDKVVKNAYYKRATASQVNIMYDYNNETHISYIRVRLPEEGKNISIETIDPESKINSKVKDGLVPVYVSSRDYNFEDFKINDRENSIQVYTSDQLYFAVQYGFKPICGIGSPAQQMMNAAKAVMRNIVDDSMTDFEKVYALYVWFIQNIDYDHKAIMDTETEGSYLYKKHNNAYAWHMEGVFNKKIAVCDGMSKAFVLMCGLENIPCIRVVSENHAWNKVYIDLDNNGAKEWYGVDVTWGSMNVDNIGCVDVTEHFLFTDSFKTHKGAIQFNFLDVAATTEVNPYELVTYEDDNTGDIYDTVIESKDELKNIIVEAVNNVKGKPKTQTFVSISIELDYDNRIMTNVTFPRELNETLIEMGMLSNLATIQDIGTYRVVIILKI